MSNQSVVKLVSRNGYTVHKFFMPEINVKRYHGDAELSDHI